MNVKCLHVGTCVLLGDISFPEEKKRHPRPPKKSLLVLTWTQIPFLVEGLLPVDRGISTGASVRHVALLAPLGR